MSCVSLDRRQLFEKILHGGQQRCRVGSDLGQDRSGDALGLFEKRSHEVGTTQLRLALVIGQALGGLEGFLEFESKLIRIHGWSK